MIARRERETSETELRMGFIIVIIISMLLFDLCECVLWKSIHTLGLLADSSLLSPLIALVRSLTLAVALALALAQYSAHFGSMHELSLYSFVCFIWVHTSTIHLVMNDDDDDGKMLLI